MKSLINTFFRRQERIGRELTRPHEKTISKEQTRLSAKYARRDG